MKDKYEYEEVEEFHNELVKKEQGTTKIDLDEYESIEKILHYRDNYRNAQIAERLLKEVLKQKKEK